MCDDVMLYAKASRGFKAGGFDASDRIGDARSMRTNKSPHLKSEVKLLCSMVELRLMRPFHGNYEDLQVQAFDGTLAF